MINKLNLLISDNTYPYRNLAVEEYLTRSASCGEITLFLWQNKKTVVIGRNQNSFKECNIEALEADGGYIVRRLSGGGAVFHDLGNLNFTFCVRKSDYDVVKQTEVILVAVKKMGINAERTGRNDLTVQGRKFSGHAFWQTGDCCYHHGTILLKTDSSSMTKYLKPDKEKLRSKGVDSVSSRVCNLTEFSPNLTVHKMKEALWEAFEEVYGLHVNLIDNAQLPDDILKASTACFESKEWIYGKNHTFDHEFGERFSWGDVHIGLCVTGNIIREADISSDAMNQYAIQVIANSLTGCEYKRSEMIAAVESLQLTEDLSGADTYRMKRDIADLICKNV